MNKNKSALMLLAGMLLTATGYAQTYTTVKSGNWNSPTTWSGGLVPGRTISAAMTVNVNHDVAFNISGDFAISGKLNINDSLTFATAYDGKLLVGATGIVTVRNGALLTKMSSGKVEMEINGGKLFLDNAQVEISKSMKAFAGSRRSYKNSVVHIGGLYEMTGTSGSPIIDTVESTTIEVSKETGGDFLVKSYCTMRVKNAIVVVNNGNFLNESNSTINVLPNAVSNYGFNLLKTSKDLENKGAWTARIDAHCVGGTIKGSQMAAIDLTRSEDCNLTVATAAYGTAPELVFKNPFLKSGQAKKEGAVYRFPNVSPGVDAEIKLKDFSRNDIVMQSIDLDNMGWDKAFQPQFGLNGLVAPNQNWYIDFELSFYKAGTNVKQKMAKVDMTALDVDGDGVSVKEYAMFEAPSNVIYSTVSYLTNQSAGLLGQLFVCTQDLLPSVLLSCIGCGGDGKVGIWNIDECSLCDGSGLIHTLCNHGFDGVNGSSLQGPVENFLNIDTLATQVMATYQYVDKDKIKFRYGAKSGSSSSNGAGVRLNSLWFRQFSLAPAPGQILPVKIGNFSAQLANKTVRMNWTGYEEDFSHYIMQRSTDGKEYQNIGIILPTNSGNQWNEYKYMDMNVSSPTGTLFYRLQLVDKVEETAKFSDVRVIRLNGEQANMQLATYPNPASSQVRVTLPAAWQGKPSVMELLNANGTVIFSTQTSSSNQTETLDISKFPKGIYFVKVTCEGATAQQRVLKN